MIKPTPLRSYNLLHCCFLVLFILINLTVFFIFHLVDGHNKKKVLSFLIKPGCLWSNGIPLAQLREDKTLLIAIIEKYLVLFVTTCYYQLG